MLEKLKKRWNLSTNWDVIAVLIIFSLAGSTSVYIRRPIFDLLEINKETMPWFQYSLVYLLVFMPAYQLLFLTWGFVWRQWDFAWAFEKKMFKRMLYIQVTAGVLYAGYVLI